MAMGKTFLGQLLEGDDSFQDKTKISNLPPRFRGAKK